LLSTRSQKVIGFLNQHGFNLAVEDRAVLDDFAVMDFLLRDGVGIKIACQYKNLEPGANLNGTDFIPTLMEKAGDSDQTIDYFVLGTESPWLEQGSKKLLGGRKCHLLHGFHEEGEYLDFVRSRARDGALSIVLLAMGMPKQERVASVLRDNMKAPALVICGGAIIDFQAGRFKRAPQIMRKLNLEWLFRLSREPQRLFSRYILGIPKFLFYLALKK